MPSNPLPLAYLAGKRIRVPDRQREYWDNYINARQVAALLHIPERRVFRLVGEGRLPPAKVHEPSLRQLWWPADVHGAATRLARTEAPQWLDVEALGNWLRLPVEAVQELVEHGELPAEDREYRGKALWRPEEIREAIDDAESGFACTFESFWNCEYSED